MNNSKKTLKELSQLNVNLRNEVEQFTEWSKNDKINFITPILNTGETGKLAIIVSNGEIADGRQMLLTIKQYFNDDIEKEIIGNFIPYSMLSVEARDFVDNIEFGFIEVK